MNRDELVQREFLSMPLRPATMTFYSVRTAVLRSVKEETARFAGSVLDVGCGFMPYRELIESVPGVESYTGMDLESSSIYAAAEPDLKWNGKDIPAAEQSFDCVMATEFLEHHADPETVLIEIRRVMKTDGVFFATVPFLWNLHEIPHDEYRYTPYSIDRHLRNAGFRDIRIKALGGWNLSLAQMIGLWVGFSGMDRRVRALMRIVLFPVYYFLVKTDVRPTEFDGLGNSMFTGLSVTAIK